VDRRHLALSRGRVDLITRPIHRTEKGITMSRTDHARKSTKGTKAAREGVLTTRQPRPAARRQGTRQGILAAHLRGS